MICTQSENGKFPLVLLHGWGLNSAVWQLVIADLEQYFDVHCIDLPGFGVNQGIQMTDYELDTLVDHIAPLCPQECLLVGWSLGGLVATRLAQRYPHKVATLCLVASTPCFVEQPQWKGIKSEVLDSFSASLGQDPGKTIERFLAIQAMGSSSARNDIKWLKNEVLKQGSADIGALVGGLMILKQVDLRPQLTQLNLPVTGIFGRLDALVATRSISHLAPELNNFEFKVIDKASHAPFISHPEQFMDDFMTLHQTFLD